MPAGEYQYGFERAVVHHQGLFTPGQVPSARGEYINIGNDCPIERMATGDERLVPPTPTRCYARNNVAVADFRMVSGRDMRDTRASQPGVFGFTAIRREQLRGSIAALTCATASFRIVFVTVDGNRNDSQHTQQHLEEFSLLPVALLRYECSPPGVGVGVVGVFAL